MELLASFWLWPACLESGEDSNKTRITINQKKNKTSKQLQQNKQKAQPKHPPPQQQKKKKKKKRKEKTKQTNSSKQVTFDVVCRHNRTLARSGALC